MTISIRRQFLELEYTLSMMVRDLELGETEEAILCERTMTASEFVVFDKMPIFPVNRPYNEGWINLLIDGKKFFGEKGFPLNYIGRWTYLVSDFIVYAPPGQKFTWTLMPRAGESVELLIPYLFMDGVDAIYALRLVDLGIVVNMSNVNWYRRTIIEGREEEIIREAGQRILIDQMRHRFDYNPGDFDMIDDGDGEERGFRKLNIRDGDGD